MSADILCDTTLNELQGKTGDATFDLFMKTTAFTSAAAVSGTFAQTKVNTACKLGAPITNVSNCYVGNRNTNATNTDVTPVMTLGVTHHGSKIARACF